MTKKTLAELKRTLKVGTKLLKVAGLKEKGIGEIREITKVQTNAIVIGTSWLYYPSYASLLEFNDDTFSVYTSINGTKDGLKAKDGIRGELIGTYKIVG